MRLTSPQEKESVVSELNVVLSKFEEQLRKAPINQKSYHLDIDMYCDAKMCKEIAKLYRNIGWVAECLTYTPIGKSVPCTHLNLWRKKSDKPSDNDDLL